MRSARNFLSLHECCYIHTHTIRKQIDLNFKKLTMKNTTSLSIPGRARAEKDHLLIKAQVHILQVDEWNHCKEGAHIQHSAFNYHNILFWPRNNLLQVKCHHTAMVFIVILLVFAQLLLNWLLASCKPAIKTTLYSYFVAEATSFGKFIQ